MFLFEWVWDLFSMVFGFLSSLIGLAVMLLFAFGAWRVFQKMGEPGWKALIPIYNVYVLTAHLWTQPLLFLLMFLPVVNVVFGILSAYRLALAFRKGVGFTVGLILLAPFFFLILGLGPDPYTGR